MDTPPSARTLNPNIPESLEKIIQRLLEKDPAKRYGSALELIADLNGVTKALAPQRAGSVSDGSKSPETPTLAEPRPSGSGGISDSTYATQPSLDARPALAKSPLPNGRGSARRRWPLLLGLAAVVVLGIVIFWPTPQGTVRIESDDPDVQIVFDLTGPNIKGMDRETIQLRAGEHGFVVKRGDLKFETTKFFLKKDQTVTLKVELLPGKLQVVQDGQVVASRKVPLAQSFKNVLGMEFVLVSKGKFWMGGSGGNVGDKEVEIGHDFYLGKYEVTQEEWEKVTGVNPSHFRRFGVNRDAVKDIADADLKRFPVERVSWDDCQAFLKVVNEKAKITGWEYRLPTEAEWEYSCRGGPSSNKFDNGFDFYFEKPSLQLQPDQANFNNILKRTCKVGSYQPNQLGLFDMHGNVWEWCQDEIRADAKDHQPASQRVSLGGSWARLSKHCRAALQYTLAPSDRHYDLGLRLACVPVSAAPVAPMKPEEANVEAPPTFKNRLGMEFVKVPKGKFWMGGTGGKVGDKEVEIPHDFYLGKCEVTQEEWEQVTGLNPSKFKAVAGVAPADQKRFPVENVSWDDCQTFLKVVIERAKETGWLYRLSTEAEWEYACRGGPSANKFDYGFDFYFEKPSLQLQPGQANSLHIVPRTCKVGSYQPNKLGLHDMHGNVFEWCQDAWKDDKGAEQRVGRGGCWWYSIQGCRAAHRSVGAPSLQDAAAGLRLARVPVGKASD